MTKKHWAKFFWSDWEADEGLRQCSLAAQGLWMRMLCLCAKGEPYGYLTIRGEPLGVEAIAKAASVAETEAAHLIAELERWAVFSRDKSERIYSRRMVRDEVKSNTARNNGRAGGNPTLVNPKPTEPLASGSGSSEGFEEFEKWYARYPHKVGRGDAEKSYFRALHHASPDALLKGLDRYIASKPKDRPWCNPATWLNQKRWLDQPADGGYQPEDSRENTEKIWALILEREAAGERWLGTRVTRADIPAAFIEQWKASRPPLQEGG